MTRYRSSGRRSASTAGRTRAPGAGGAPTIHARWGTMQGEAGQEVPLYTSWDVKLLAGMMGAGRCRYLTSVSFAGQHTMGAEGMREVCRMLRSLGKRDLHFLMCALGTH